MLVGCAEIVGVDVGGRLMVVVGDGVIAICASDAGFIVADTSDSNDAPEAQARK